MTYDLNDVWAKPLPAVKSPCKNICVVSSTTGYCVGCFRLLSEIKDWETSTAVEKEIILAKCKKREQDAIPTNE
jgi:predicted Fe-S protein YdhL (DUF1289 family)